MSTTRILHCADLHLDSPFLGLAELDEGAASTLRESTFRSFGRLVDHAIDQRVDLVTVGGDVYDSEDHGLRSAIRFRDELKRLSAAGIPCAVVAGNHDPLDSRRLRGDLPPGCKLFGSEPERWELDRPRGERLVVYGQSYPRAKMGDDLARRIIDRYEAGSGLQVAVLHCNVGAQGGHANYAPCSLSQLAAAPLDAWLLGQGALAKRGCRAPWIAVSC